MSRTVFTQGFSSKEAMLGPAVLGGCAWPWPPIPQSHRKALSALDFFGVTSPEKNPSKGKRMGRVCREEKRPQPGVFRALRQMPQVPFLEGVN